MKAEELNKRKSPSETAGTNQPQVCPNELKHLVENSERLARGEEIKKDAENAVPPEAWKNQKKAYNDAWENNKNQMIDDDM